MDTRINTYVQLMQSLLLEIQPVAPSRPQATEQLQALQALKREVAEALAGKISGRLQSAVTLLHRLACLDLFYSRRCQALEEQALSAPELEDQLGDLAGHYQRTLSDLAQDWPELDASEAATLPRMLLLQRIEQEIQQLKPLFNFQPSRLTCAA